MTLPPSSHEGTETLTSGSPLGKASRAVIMIHGRGGTAEDILSLTSELKLADVSYLAPQAAGSSWYPNSFMAPLASNEPWLSSALELIDSLVLRCEAAALPSGRIAILGFSQGACVATEYMARYPSPYGALVAFTGGLIGPPGYDLHHSGSLPGTQVLLSSGDPDPHVPWSRVEETARELQAMGASVQLSRHPGRPHMVLREEIEQARELLDAL